MKYFFRAIIFTILLAVLSGCISYDQITQPTSGSDRDKIARFDYMETNWSYIHGRWMLGQRIMPEELEHGWGISYPQAKEEVDEFVKLQYNYNWFHCFLISIYLNEIRFYVD
ncbi:MAG TPA: hypothetical protein DD381_01705 [Lentisphaeria bacterium]|nr:MAG: hypothetical protein A2X47_10325 [Lentisphaerae bacterium GWF2_38_69]HBM15057.1 hypothetical protein [Lentisphaeria bacterium]